MKLIIIHQHDPTVHHVGGIGTFIDTFIRNAPPQIDIELIGVTTQTERYPIGQWHNMSIDQREYKFLPLVAADPINITPIPLTLKMLFSLFYYRRKLDLNGAIIELHRIEPMLAFCFSNIPKVLFLHGNNLKDFYNKKSEVRWERFPWLYFLLEKTLLLRTKHTYIVREDAVEDYQKRYPGKADDFSFLPTWVDEEVFRVLSAKQRKSLRDKLIAKHGLHEQTDIYLFVGRFEGQKDPMLLLNAFVLVKKRNSNACLLLIGEGSLKGDMLKFIDLHQLTDAVHFLPPMSQRKIADWMSSANVLCLSSAFEGMPRVVVEALHCGLPVVSTDTGETDRLIGEGKGGLLVREEGVDVFADAMEQLINNPPSIESCRKQVELFTAKKVLASVYQYYEELLEGKQ